MNKGNQSKMKDTHEDLMVAIENGDLNDVNDCLEAGANLKHNNLEAFRTAKIQVLLLKNNLARAESVASMIESHTLFSDLLNRGNMNNPLQTSLTEIAKHDPCKVVWHAVLKLRGHEPCSVEDFKGDDALFNVSEIGKLENVDWLFWTARLYKGKERDIYHHFAIWCAMRVEHLMKDERSKHALKVARDYLEGKASQEEALDAYASAVDAAINADDDATHAAARATSGVVDAAADATHAAIIYAVDAAARDADDSYRIAIINERRNQLEKLTESLDNGVFEYE